MEPQKPPGFENYLSAFGPVIHDGWCGEPVAWRFKIIRHLDGDFFRELGKHGQLECIDGFKSSWALIIKMLSRQEAMVLYGAVTEEIFGPRGGWKSTTFGNKKFISGFLKPEKQQRY